MGCQRVAQAERKVGHHKHKYGMAVVAMTTIVAMRRRLVVQKIETIIVVLAVIMAVTMCRHGIDMPVQCVLRRPDYLERHEPHQRYKQRTTHGTRW